MLSFVCFSKLEAAHLLTEARPCSNSFNSGFLSSDDVLYPPWSYFQKSTNFTSEKSTKTSGFFQKYDQSEYQKSPQDKNSPELNELERDLTLRPVKCSAYDFGKPKS